MSFCSRVEEHQRHRAHWQLSSTRFPTLAAAKKERRRIRLRWWALLKAERKYLRAHPDDLMAWLKT